MKTILKTCLTGFFLLFFFQTSFAQKDEVYSKYKTGILDQLTSLKYEYFRTRLKLSDKESKAFWEVFDKINNNDTQQKIEALKMKNEPAEDKMLMQLKNQITRAENEILNYDLLKSVLSEENLVRYYELESEFRKEMQALLN